MSRSPSMLASALGVSARTFERWCEQGGVPGAYRTKGGHWRIRRPSEQVILKLISTRDYHKTRKGRITELLFLYSLPPPPPDIKALARSPGVVKGLTGGKLLNVAAQVALAACEISDADIESKPVELARRDPDKYRIMHETPVGKLIRRDHWQAAEQPTALLMVKATTLRLNQGKVTASILARALGISRRTLYNRYGRDAVKAACLLGRPGCVVLPSRPKIRRGVRLPKAA